MNKYAILKRFHSDRRLKVYMYDFMYVNPDSIPVEDYFPETKTFFDKYKKMSTPGPVLKYWLVFDYICSEDYELDVKLDENGLEKQSDQASNNKVKLLRENMLAIEEEWFSGMYLTDGATFPTDLVKCTKSRN